MILQPEVVPFYTFPWLLGLIYSIYLTVAPNNTFANYGE
jgi:hypothetical protein